MMKPNLQQAFILHSRPFRETSLILELLTRDNGRVSVLARGAKRSKKTANLFQPFLFLDVAWRGKSDLPTLTTIESNAAPVFLKQKSLMCGLYLNELLIRVMHRHDPHAEIFELYKNTLFNLQNGNLEIPLRLFEKKLLIELGYGINFLSDAETGEPINAEKFYNFSLEHGFVESIDNHKNFNGENIIAIANNDYANAEILLAAKKIMRMAYRPLIGEAPLRSRDLFG